MVSLEDEHSKLLHALRQHVEDSGLDDRQIEHRARLDPGQLRTLLNGRAELPVVQLLGILQALCLEPERFFEHWLGAPVQASRRAATTPRRLQLRLDLSFLL